MNITEQINSAASANGRLPRPNRLPFLLSAATLLGFWAAVIFQISAQWAVYEQYAYGWAVPFLCAWLGWTAWKFLMASSPRPSPPFEERGKTGGSAAFSGVALGIIAVSALFFFPTWVVVEANPIWRAASYLITLEVIAITLGMLYVAGGVAWLRRFAFPVCFFLVAIPWPSALENLVIQSLTRFNTAAAVEIISAFGIPVLQHGNVIEISAGMVGVDEACSGVRSIQTTLMMTLFFGAFYRLNWRRRGWLIAAGMGLALVCNLCRTSFLVWIASRDGLPAMEKWHDPAGVTILVTCFVGIWLVAELLSKRQARNVAAEQPESTLNSQPANSEAVSSRWDGVAAPPSSSDFIDGQGGAAAPPYQAFSQLSTVSLALLIWLAGTLVVSECWFRFHEHQARAVADWSVKWPKDKRDFRDIPISANALSQLKCNESHNYSWRESDGTAWQAFYLRWFPAGNLKDRATVHLAKTHRPEHCLTAAGKALKEESAPQVFTLGELNLPYRSLVFDDRGRNLHVFFVAWEDDTPAGTYANMRDNNASRLAAAWAGNRGKGQRVMEVAIWGLPDLKSAEAAFHKFMAESVEAVEVKR